MDGYLGSSSSSDEEFQQINRTLGHLQDVLPECLSAEWCNHICFVLLFCVEKNIFAKESTKRKESMFIMLFKFATVVE